MRRRLENYGFNVVTADSAEEAQHLLQWGETYTMVITDINMPWLNGIQFCRNAKATHPDLKIFALTGCLDDYDEAELNSSGFDGVYEKPLSEAHLQQILGIN